MAFKLKGMSHGEGTGAHTRKPEYKLPDEMSSAVNMGKHPLHMTGRYNSPVNMMDQNASSPHKIAPLVAYGISALGGIALRKAALWGTKKVIKKVVKKHAKKITSKNLMANISKSIPASQRYKSIARLNKAKDWIFGTSKWGKLASAGTFAWPVHQITKKFITDPNVPTYDPTDDTTTENKKKNKTTNRKRTTTKTPKTPTSGTDISKKLKEEYLRKALGLSGTDVDINKLIGGGSGDRKRSKLWGAKKTEHKTDPITGATTTTKTKGKSLFEGKKIKSKTTLPGGTTIKKKEKYGKKVTGEGDTGDWWTNRRKKSKTTIKTKDVVVKVKKKRGKTIVKTRKRGGIFSKRTRIS